MLTSGSMSRPDQVRAPHELGDRVDASERRRRLENLKRTVAFAQRDSTSGNAIVLPARSIPRKVAVIE